MSNQNAYLQTFAGGEFGEAMSARVGIEAYQASCEVMENFLCQAQGPMFRRPPLEYIDSFVDSTKKGVIKGFQFDVGQNYLCLVTEDGIEFFLNDGKLTIPEITATISNGTFASFTDWTDASASGSSAGASGGYLALTSNGASESKARTTFTINEADVLHVLSFDVINGPVSLHIGSSAGGEQFLSEQELRTGRHQISFTPSGSTCHIEFWHKGDSIKRVDNVTLMTGPAFSVPVPWDEDDMRGVYAAQDGDRMFLFHRDYPPRVLERRGHRSWSLIFFEPDDGPFDDGDSTIKLTTSATTGEVTITASKDLFTADDVRRLLRLTHDGQSTKMVASSDAVYGEPVKISGIAADRALDFAVTGTWVGTLTLQRSVGNTNQFSDVLSKTANDSGRWNDTYTEATASGGANDTDLHSASGDVDVQGSYNNLTVYYRWVVKPGNYTSGTITATLTASTGSTTGLARIVAYSSATSVTAEVLSHFSKAGATDVWDFGAWCDEEEWPNAIAFSASRLWAGRRRRLWASKTDDYFSFDDGEALADELIDITLRSKSSEGIRWMRHLDFLCVGTRNEEYVIRSNNTSEGIGPTTIDPGLMSEEGGASVEAVVGGDSILFVHRSGRRLMQFAHNPRALSESSFIAIDLNRLNPEAVEDGIVNIAIQQEPERRIYAILKNGTVKTALFRREEDIVAWSTMRSEGGFIEDVCIFPEDDIDAVYFIVRRFINGSWVRMIERLASEVVLNREDMVHLDSYLSTAIERPEAVLSFDTIEENAEVEVTASDDVFEAGHVGQILWADDGRILIDTFNSATSVTGTILNGLTGELDPDDAAGLARIPALIPPLKWGIAEPVSSLTGADHLNGETVLIWADCGYAGTAVVSGGNITLPYEASRVFVGKRMISKWKGLKLAYGSQKGTAVNQVKQSNSMGFVLRRTANGLKFGQDFHQMKFLEVQPTSIAADLGPPFFSGEKHEALNGRFAVDPRLTLKIDTPGPVTIAALIPNVQVNER